MSEIVTHYTAKEGGQWILFGQETVCPRIESTPVPTGFGGVCTLHFVQSNGGVPFTRSVHSLQFADGRQWDCINGFRDTVHGYPLHETSEHYRRVKRFMQLAKQDTPDYVLCEDAIPNYVKILRAKLMLEEVLETIRKGLGLDVSILHQSFHNGESDFDPHVEHVPLDDDATLHFEVARRPDLVEILDGCADVSVVNTGTLIAVGLWDSEPLRIVDENNLAKFGPGGYRRGDGKWIKPPNHEPPEKKLAREISRQYNLQRVVFDKEIPKTAPGKPTGEIK